MPNCSLPCTHIEPSPSVPLSCLGFPPPPAGLPKDFTEEHLNNIFSPYGPIAEAQVRTPLLGLICKPPSIPHPKETFESSVYKMCALKMNQKIKSEYSPFRLFFFSGVEPLRGGGGRGGGSVGSLGAGELKPGWITRFRGESKWVTTLWTCGQSGG